MRLEILLIAASLALQTRAACDCGYAINSTDSPSHAFFTDYIETDFLQLQDVSYSGIGDTGWLPQIWNQTAAAARGQYGRSQEISNIVSNTAFGGNVEGLQLWVRSKVEDGMVSGAEIATNRTDILYGTFRVGMRVTGIAGTCSAFFWYRNDTQEIDMEILSKNVSIVNAILQSDASVGQGFNAQDTPTYQQYDAHTPLAQQFHEYRFDWLPGRVEFFFDGAKITGYMENVPNSPGHLMLSHWSNGNEAWSMGPPVEDATTTISYVKAYFNVSGSDKAFTCASQVAVCLIPEQTAALGSVSGNGSTSFFNPPPAQSSAPTSSATPTLASDAISPCMNANAWIWAWIAYTALVVLGC